MSPTTPLRGGAPINSTSPIVTWTCRSRRSAVAAADAILVGPGATVGERLHEVLDAVVDDAGPAAVAIVDPAALAALADLEPERFHERQVRRPAPTEMISHAWRHAPVPW